MTQQVGRVGSVLAGVIGACCLALAAALFAMWVMDGGGYRAAWAEGLGSVVLAGCGAALLRLARALRGYAEASHVVRHTPPA